jgi:hypothetical protein
MNDFSLVDAKEDYFWAWDENMGHQLENRNGLCCNSACRNEVSLT